MAVSGALLVDSRPPRGPSACYETLTSHTTREKGFGTPMICQYTRLRKRKWNSFNENMISISSYLPSLWLNYGVLLKIFLVGVEGLIR